jgi:hypothetical protein
VLDETGNGLVCVHSRQFDIASFDDAQVTLRCRS